MFDRFSEPALRAVALAEAEASTLRHEYTGTGHLVLGLLRQRDSSAARVLESLGISLEGARAQLVRILGAGEEGSFDQKALTPRAKLVLELALREAHLLGNEEVATHHILLALWRGNEGVGASILLRLDVDDEQVPEEITRMLSGEKESERPGDPGAAEPEDTPSGHSGEGGSWEALQRDRWGARARLKRELRGGSADLAELIRNPPPQVLTARVFDLLLVAGGPTGHRGRGIQAMANARISKSRTLDALSTRQRRRLIEHLSDPPSQG